MIGGPNSQLNRHGTRPAVKTGNTNSPYAAIWLRKSGTPPLKKKIHFLVADAFIGPRPDGLIICHNDGVAMNPHVENLRYDTRGSNMRDRYLMIRWTIEKVGQRAIVPTSTHCCRGHKFAPETTHYTYTKTGRQQECRVCRGQLGFEAMWSMVDSVENVRRTDLPAVFKKRYRRELALGWPAGPVLT
jgi:hypothetical protein